MTRQLRDRPRRQRLPCSNLCDAAVRKSPETTPRWARNLRRTLRTAAAGARLIQADGLDRKSAADDSACLADALDELHRLKRRLDRRIRRGTSRASTLPHITTSEASRAAY